MGKYIDLWIFLLKNCQFGVCYFGVLFAVYSSLVACQPVSLYGLNPIFRTSRLSSAEADYDLLFKKQFQKKPDVSPEEAEKMKKRWGIRKGSLTNGLASAGRSLGLTPKSAKKP